MPFMEWTKEFEFGIPQIDHQHQHWLEMINRFYDQIDDVAYRSNVKELLQEAIEYTHYHFKTEEDLMKDIGYPAIAEQKAQHAEIAKRIENFRDSITEDTPVVSMFLTEDMKEWFRHHIMEEDRKYATLYLRVKSEVS